MTDFATLFTNGGIKSIQSGSIVIAGSSTSQTATISTVNTAKSFVFNRGYGYQTTTAINCPAVTLTNSTTVTASAITAVGADTTVYYTVVEYN